MEPKNLTLALLTLLMAFSLSAQPPAEKINFISIGITPFNMIEPITPTFETAVEVHLRQRVNFEVRYGLPFFNTSNIHPVKQEENYSEFKAGIKYRLTPNRHGSLRSYLYLAWEYFHVDDRYIYQNDSYYRQGTYYDYDAAKVTRKVNGSRLKIGHQLQLGKIFTFDYALGFGIRQVSIDYITNNERPQPYYFREWEGLFDFRGDRSAGIHTKPDFSIGVKFAAKIFNW